MSYNLTQPVPSSDAPPPGDHLTMPPPPPYVPYFQTTQLKHLTKVVAVGVISLLLLVSFLALGLGPH